MPLTALALNNKYSLFCKELKPINLSCGALTCSQDYNKSIGVTPQNLLSHYREERSPYNFPSHVQCRPLMISSQSGVLCRRAELEVPTKASTDKNIYISHFHTHNIISFSESKISLLVCQIYLLQSKVFYWLLSQYWHVKSLSSWLRISTSTFNTSLQMWG